jgi:hypothetical protein
MRIKSIWLVLTVIGCFLFIHAGYNHPIDSFFWGLLWLVKQNGVSISPDNLPLQFITLAVFLIIAALFEKKMLVVIGVVMLLLLVSLWYYMLSSSIEFNYFSMIPFVFSSSFTILFLTKSIHKKRMEKGENK